MVWSVLQVIGAAAIVGGAWMTAPAAGLLVAGVAAVCFGVAGKIPPRDERRRF